MSHVVIDDIIKDWGDRLGYGRVHGKKCRTARCGPTESDDTPRASAAALRGRFLRTVRRTPEVMVRISGGGKNMRHIKAHLDYITRNGAIELEDETGLIYKGKADVREVRDAWAKGGIGIPYEGEKRKEAYNIILSMPPGTDRQAVKDAARAFAEQDFENHQYAFAAHEDEAHSHVHLVVKAINRHGVRLNPRKEDLHRWRELFAERLCEQGIEANATPRQARGIVARAEKQVVRHMERRGVTPWTKASRLASARREAAGGHARKNPAQDKISVNNEAIRSTYERAARVLAGGDVNDQRLALQIVHFIQGMPAPITQHQAMVRALRMNRATALATPTPSIERSRDGPTR
jgi:hypothetical protein